MAASDESLQKDTPIISSELNYCFPFGLRRTRSNIRALATNSYIFRVINFEFILVRQTGQHADSVIALQNHPKITHDVLNFDMWIFAHLVVSTLEL